MPPVLRALEPAAGERSGAPVSADSAGAAIAADRPLDSTPAPGTAAAHGLRALDGDPVRVAIVGATGYVGAELVRLLARHPHVEHRRPRRPRAAGRPAGRHPPPPRDRRACGSTTPSPTSAEAVFLALPHGAAAAPRSTSSSTPGQTVIDLGPDFRLRDPADYPRWYHFDHPRPDLLDDRRLRPARAAPRRARRGRPRAERHRRRARLLRDDHDPRARAARPRRAHRRPRRRRQERRLGRRPRPQGRTSSSARSTRASRRTGSSPTATSARSSRSSARWAAAWRRTRASAASTSCPT